VFDFLKMCGAGNRSLVVASQPVSFVEERKMKIEGILIQK
jgi:hypothetical protein